MTSNPDLSVLKTSWTKYDIVQVINMVANNEIEKYISKQKYIDEPILRSFLGIKSLSEPIPDYWKEIYKYPNQIRLFALVTTLFTHYQNIIDFGEKYGKENMGGLYIVEDGKRATNVRSALVEGEAALRKYRRQPQVPYNFSKLFSNGKVGLLFKSVLKERLHRIGFNISAEEEFYKKSLGLNFHKTLSLTVDQYRRWLNGSDLESNFNDLEPVNPAFKNYREISGLKVKQWLNEWNEIDFTGTTRQEPPHHFVIFNIDARLLKRLSDVHRRKADKARTDDGAVQRKQSSKRSEEIEKYVHGGFPWSTLKENQQNSIEYQNLKMPGILPTAIIANILGPGQKRNNNTINNNDLIRIEEVPKTNFVKIHIPDSIFEDDWNPELLPIEIIDGQHRLLAFDDYEVLDGDYELPVVAYYNLDLTWQAYLFYTINIKPVKINTSLGFDLYPLLRTQEWLEKSRDTLLVYRETRAQELVEALWIYKESPWHNRINMLGEAGGPTISQAAFIRALTSSFLKSGKESSYSMGGLFGDILDNKNNQVVNWNRSQQAGFLVLLWELIEKAIANCKYEWAISLRTESQHDNIITPRLDQAFAGKNSLLSRDQGVRGISMFANDFFYALANSEDWDLNDFYWDEELDEKKIEIYSIEEAIKIFAEDKIFDVLERLAELIAKFDWRTTSAEFDGNEELRNKQALYKGSSGYKEIWKGLIKIFLESNDPELIKFTLLVAEKA